MSKTEKNIISAQHRGNGPEHVGNSVSSLVKKLLGGKGTLQIELFAEWEKIVGDGLSDYTIPQKIDFKKDSRSNGVLHVVVRDGACALEVSQIKPVILEKINTYFGYLAVTDLRITINDALFNFTGDIKDDDKTEKTLVSQAQQNYIDELAEGIENSDLKARLKKLGESILKSENQED